MSRNTRQEILDTAKALFNERGYNDVTLRDIAGVMGISKGNLTYHFKKKEDIIEALISQSASTRPDTPPRTLEQLDAFFLDLQQAVQTNAYYFLHYTQLSQTIESIQAAQSANYFINMSLLHEAFSTLHGDNLLRDESFSGEYACVIDALHLSGIFWNTFTGLKREPDSGGEYRHHAWGLMHGLLTQKGRVQLETFLRL